MGRRRRPPALVLLRAIDAIKLEEAACDGDERTGLRILDRALEAPTRAIAENSGFDDGVVVDRMRAGTGNHGFDAARGVYCDLVEAGIIDPTKVVRMALENAVSVAGVLLHSEATMTEPHEPGKHEHPSAEPRAPERAGARKTRTLCAAGAARAQSVRR